MTLVYIAALIAFVVVARSAVRGYKGTTEPATHICVDCGTKCSGVTSHRAGWTFLFFPWNLIFAEKKMQSCPACMGRLIPLESPKGIQINA
jgi:hypothetical protein